MDKARQGGLRILFADDEAHLRDLMQMELPRMGHEVTVCPDGTAALKALERGLYDAALLDLKMPGLSGIDVLAQIRQTSPETQVIILTGHATVDTAVQALRHGAFDYLTKPCKWAELEMILNRVAERRDMANKTTALETRLKAAEGSPLLIGETPTMLQVRRLIDTIAPTDASVMILGETGTGKELVARSIHDKSRRADRAFIPVNCGALPDNLVESELFGHRKGAFTGADTNRKGLFEVANGGTLFLDEVGELDKSVQVKLLRFLESGEIRRVGENEPFHVDVRVLCATNRDLRDMVGERTVPRRPVLPAQYLRDLPAPPARAQARHRRARQASPDPSCDAPRVDGISHRTGIDRALDGPRMAGQYPRAGQHDRASHDPGRQRTDPSRTPADPAPDARQGVAPEHAQPGRRTSFPGSRRQSHTPRCRNEIHPGHSREAPGEQTRRLPRAGDQLEDPLQQD